MLLCPSVNSRTMRRCAHHQRSLVTEWRSMIPRPPEFLRISTLPYSLPSKFCFLHDTRLFWIGRIPHYEGVVLLCLFPHGLWGYTVLDWMLLGGTYTVFRLLYCLTYKGSLWLPWIPPGIDQLSILLSLLQRLMSCPTYGLPWLQVTLIGLVGVGMLYILRDMRC